MEIRELWPRGKDGFPKPESFGLRAADGFEVLHYFFEVHPVRRAEFWGQPGKIFVERKPRIVEFGKLGFFFDNGFVFYFLGKDQLKIRYFLFRGRDHHAKVTEMVIGQFSF